MGFFLVKEHFSIMSLIGCTQKLTFFIRKTLKEILPISFHVIPEIFLEFLYEFGSNLTLDFPLLIHFNYFCKKTPS